MNYDTIRLTDIAMHTLTPHKVTLKYRDAQDHCRWVLRGSLPGSSKFLFYKIWNPTYLRRDNILAAIDSGFYDDRMVPALFGIVFHKGLCRGYVMHEGKTGKEILTDEFRNFVFLRTKQTGFFAVQFARCHTMIYERRLSLFDLEAVYPIGALPQLSLSHSRFEDPAYRNFVLALYKQQDSKVTSVSPSSDLSVSASREANCGGLRHFMDTRRFCKRLSRRITRKFRNVVPRTQLIEY